MRLTSLRPCNDCPFRRNAAPGWLGPWTAEGLIASLDFEPFPCHQTIQSRGDDYDDDHLQGCAGAAIFLNNSFAMSRVPETCEHQKQLKDVPASVKESVFKWKWEFTEYHNTFPIFDDEEEEDEC